MDRVRINLTGTRGLKRGLIVSINDIMLRLVYVSHKNGYVLVAPYGDSRCQT